MATLRGRAFIECRCYHSPTVAPTRSRSFSVMARTPDFTPPQELFPHRLDYAEVAQNLFELVKDLCEVTPTDRVLDVGCGAGRLAGPLTDV